MKKIIIHIGLPKTATSSIQKYLFPFYDSSKFLYLGVFQPRNQKNQRKEFKAVLHALDCEENIRDKAILEAKKVLNEFYMSEKPKSLIISEEGITVDSPLTCWQEKLVRLKEVIKNFDYQLIVTVREPIKASYSLYCELFPLIKNNHPNFNSFYNNDNSARIFRYDELLNNLFKNFNQKKIHFVPFELIKDDKKFIEKINYATGYSLNNIDSLDKSNFKEKGSDGYIARATNIGDIAIRLRGSQFGKFLMKLPIAKLILKSIFEKIKSFSLPSKKTEIPFFTIEEKKQLKTELNEGIELLYNVTGIDYR